MTPRKSKQKVQFKQARKKKSAPKKSARRHFEALRRASVDKKSRRKKSATDSRMIAAKNLSKPIGKLFEDLVALQARLRAPGGCPWDREQTHATLQTYLIEETYEVLDALDKGNAKELADELGDLLLQVLFHADLAREAGSFDISDVITGIHNKMVRRHPHVFGNVKADTPDEVLKNWTQLKAAERQAASAESWKAISTETSVLEGVSRSLPALLEAYQLSRRASRVGFDWNSINGIFEKLHEESVELRDAIEKPERADQVEEVGDILFVAVNLARFLKIDPEVALKHSNLKFKTRFIEMEAQVKTSGHKLEELSNDELEVLWGAAKASIRLEDQEKSSS